MSRERRLKKIDNKWRKTKRRMTVSVNGKKVKKLVPVKIRKKNGNYQIRKLNKRKRGPKPKKKSKSKSRSNKWE